MTYRRTPQASIERAQEMILARIECCDDIGTQPDAVTEILADISHWCHAHNLTIAAFVSDAEKAVVNELDWCAMRRAPNYR